MRIAQTMRVATGLLLAAVASVPTFVWATPAAPLTGMNRCIGADGSTIFTDRPCDTVDARPAPEAPKTASSTLADELPLARFCARTAKTLLEQVEAALASGDGNQLAALYDWRGSSNAGANAVMPRLEALTQSRVVAVTVAHSAERSQDPELAAEAAQAPPDTLRIELGPDAQSNGGMAEFRIVRAAGCLWLRD